MQDHWYDNKKWNAQQWNNKILMLWWQIDVPLNVCRELFDIKQQLFAYSTYSPQLRNLYVPLFFESIQGEMF